MRRVHSASFIEFSKRTYKLGVAPKPWESTSEIGEIPISQTGVYNCTGLRYQKNK
jgi:hypothetical protein